MKRERGSALLTVILIVFVTSTIGSALTSFVMMNYKLRNLDNRIAKAEYETEKAVDRIYMYMQESVSDTISAARDGAISKIQNDAQIELENAKAALAGGTTDLEGNYVFIQGGVIVYNNELMEAEEERQYRDYCKYNIFDEIHKNFKNLNNQSEIKLILAEEEDFDDTRENIQIKLRDKTGVDEEMITVGLELYCKLKNSPPIKFSVDFVIIIPTIENVKTGNYNLNNLINMTNWEMQDWGYL